VSGANLIFNNCLVFLASEIQRTAGFYIKTLKELSGFKEEPEVISLIQIFFCGPRVIH
jgi:hypothetical protein